MKDSERIRNDIRSRLDERKDALVDYVEAEDNSLPEAKKQLKAAQAEWKAANDAWNKATDANDKKTIATMDAKKRALTKTIQYYMDQIKKLQG